jgi:hypothetical protein
MPLTACKQYCLAAGATQGNIAYTQNVSDNLINLKHETLPIFKEKKICDSICVHSYYFNLELNKTPFCVLFTI